VIDFEELDYRDTPMGELVLRRRGEPRLGGKTVYEVKLGDEFLMSSLFSEGEVALTTLGLAPFEEQTELSVVVGGLGLGYTAAAVLDDSRVQRMLIVDTMADVIDWHQKGLVPLGSRLTQDPRTEYVHGDFFALCANGGFSSADSAARFDAVLLDIDHSPQHVLHPSHSRFYSPDGLGELCARLNPGGVFSLWSNDPPDREFEQLLRQCFASAASHVVEFANPFTGGTSANTVYVAQMAT